MTVHRLTLAIVSLVAVAGAGSHAASGHIILEDAVARSRFRYAADRSPTMKQLIAVIEQTPDISIRVRAVFGLRHSSPHAAHSVIRFEDAMIHAIVSFDPAQSHVAEQLEMLGHELGHIVEVACLPRAEIVTGLRRLLTARGFVVRQSGSRHAVETRFAIEIGRHVVLEAMKGSKEPGRLPVVARRHQLRAPCVPRAESIAAVE